MMERGGSTFHLIDQAHGRFRLTGDRQRRFPSIFHRLHPAFNFHLSSFQVPEQQQNLEPKLPGWRRLAINPREPEPGATRPTEPAPSTMKQPHPLASALAARWLGNMPTSAGPSLASPSLRRLRSGPPFSGSPDAERFRNIRISTTGMAVEFFSGTDRYHLGFGNRAAGRQRWCNPGRGRLATTTATATATTTWANGKHLQPGPAQNSCRCEDGFT